MLILIKELFNKILDTSYYPESWNHGVIHSIHKSGDKKDPNNYRGITVTSCLGKLFSTILYKRIEAYLESNNLISKEQAGFRKNYRTTDHIFVLKTAVKKILKTGQYLYSCFIDFRKAYDSVWRKGLLYKLQKLGLTGNVFKIIEAMYKSPKASIFYHGMISELFETQIGVKQGDVLSTLLFNCFINDLPKEISTNSKDPVTLFNNPIDSLLFADDLTLLSLTKEGLQRKIQTVEAYCQKWGLELNVKKTKIMIFNKTGATIKKYKFYFMNEEIESVNRYTYLGFTFSTSGKMNAGIENLLNKAKKAWFSIQRSLHKSKEKTISTYAKLMILMIL